MSGSRANPVPRQAPLALARYAVPHPDPFLCDLHVGGEDSGEALGHVSNVEFVWWLDGAAQLHADSLGYTRRHLVDRGIMWFVARHEIDYRAEVWPGDELVIATWVRDMHRVKSWRDYLIVRPADGTVVCQAATLWVLIELASRRPTRIPAEMAQRFAPLARADDPRVSQRCTSP